MLSAAIVVATEPINSIKEKITIPNNLIVLNARWSSLSSHMVSPFLIFLSR
jgi:hypothetical protein